MKEFKNYILSNKYFSWMQIFTNFLMQGVLHADKSERNYKILFSLILFLIISYIFYLIHGVLNFHYLLYSFIFSHTINFCINCNFSVLFIHRMRWFKTNKKDLFKQLSLIKHRLNKMHDKGWIMYCVSHGGICNGTLNSYSDIDVSIIRKPGFINFMKSIIFYVKEKKYADFNMVPLDIFICDSPENTIIRSNYQKNPIVLLDHNNIIDDFYKDKLKISLEEAQILNLLS